MPREVNITIRMDQVAMQAIETIKTEKKIESTSRVVRYAVIMMSALLAVQDIMELKVEDLTKMKIEKLIRKLRAIATAIEKEEDELEKMQL